MKSNPGTKTAHVAWRDTQKEKVIVHRDLEVNRPLSYPTLIKMVHICSEITLLLTLSGTAGPTVTTAAVYLNKLYVIAYSELTALVSKTPMNSRMTEMYWQTAGPLTSTSATCATTNLKSKQFCELWAAASLFGRSGISIALV